MTTETMTSTPATIASTVAQPATIASTVAQPVAVKATKPVAVKATKPVAVKATKPAVKKPVAVKAAKPAVKKAVAKPAVKKAEPKTTPRAANVFTLTAKAANEDFGSGQRFEIAKRIKKGMTRAQLIAALPDISPANISWYLSMMVSAKLAKKTAQ